MGEQSESGHLRTENVNHAVDLLKRAKVAGFIFPPHNGWVSFVYEPGDENRFDIEQANQGLLVLYDYAGDHGLWVTVYEGKKPTARIKAAFDRPNFHFDRAVFEKLGLLSAAGCAAVDAWLRRAHVWHERSRAAYLVAERMQLPRYQWFGYLAESTKEAPDATRIQVDAKGQVKRPPKPTAPHTAIAIPKKKGKGAKKKTAAKAKKTAAKKPAVKKPAAKKKTAAKKK